MGAVLRLATILACIAFPNISFAQLSTEIDPIGFNETPPPNYSYLNPSLREMRIDTNDGTIFLDKATDRLYIGTASGQIDVPLAQAAQAYANIYADGNSAVAQQILNETRSMLSDPAMLFSTYLGASLNDNLNDPRDACTTLVVCDTFDDGFDRFNNIRYIDDYWTLGANGSTPGTRPPLPQREQERKVCMQEAREIKEDTDQAFFAFGLSCASMGGSPLLGGAGCIASAQAAASLTKRFLRKVKQCQSI